ncbi:MAG: CapA family protein [Lachnospiraceae bacterium]|nr:CapA family protein [Lachnospiraceae bacterium]
MRKVIWYIAFVIIMSGLTGCGRGSQPDFDVSEESAQSSVASMEATPAPTPESTPEAAPSTPEPTEEPTPEPEQITLLMVGDILLHTPVEKSAKREDGSYSYDAIFANTKDLIEAADLALVNQEVILGGTELGISGYPRFNAPYEVGDDLVEAGFDVICHATNHAMDKGKEGVVNCLDFWEENYPEITILGLHDNPDDALYIFEKAGMKIAFLNYTYGTNGIALPSDMPYAVDLLGNKDKVLADIQLAESVADFTVVCPHWGTEYRLTADASQQKWAKLFLENGVDLVLGTHPHVIEPVELLVDETTGHSMLVYYSLGNFVNWTSSSGDGIANRMVGGMAQITLERGEDGTVAISDYGVTALVCHLESGSDGVTVYPLAAYDQDLADLNQIRKQDPAFSYEYCERLCDKVWGDLWN